MGVLLSPNVSIYILKDNSLFKYPVVMHCLFTAQIRIRRPTENGQIDEGNVGVVGDDHWEKYGIAPGVNTVAMASIYAYYIAESLRWWRRVGFLRTEKISRAKLKWERGSDLDIFC